MYRKVAMIGGRACWQFATLKSSGLVEINIVPERDSIGKACWRADIEVDGKPLTWALLYSAVRAKNWALAEVGRRVW